MNIVLWTREGDAYCRQATEHLNRTKTPFVEKCLGQGYTVDQLLASDPNATAEMPALFVDGKYVGGLREVRGLIK